MRVLHWFRRDLRLADNRALHDACQRATDGVVALFVLSPDEWRDHDDAPCKIDFWLRNLTDLKPRLAKLNIPLKIVTAASTKKVPDLVIESARKHNCAAISFNREYEVNESRRDARLIQRADQSGIETIAHHDRCILEPGTVRTQQGAPYTVYTPFMNQWLTVLDSEDVSTLPEPRKQKSIDITPDDIPAAVKGFESDIDPALWPAGERTASGRLGAFIRDRISQYKAQRDIPSVNATSTLSPYLAAGIISPRQCLHAAVESDGGVIRIGKRYKGKPSGPGAWINELVWREFYIHLTHAYPRLSMRKAFRPEYDAIPWSDDESAFHAWCKGQTGYPIVDAAMRQLNQTGWMHNRCRMIVAMFLTKDLLIDWRNGERYFMLKLIDGDLASNNGGWQWSASTGTDAAPYFRIYNPTTQAERFDPEGDYIRRWVPELADVQGDAVFDPQRLPALLRSALDYPEPLVDHAKARDRAIEVFAKVKS